MEIGLRLLALIVMVLNTCGRAAADGYIVPDGVVSNYYGGTLSRFEISVRVGPEGTRYTGFLLRPMSGNLFQFLPVLDVGVRVFFVSQNDPISLQPILDQAYPELTYPQQYLFNPGSSLLVGLYTGNQEFAPLNGIYDDPLFGWARLRNVNGTIRILDSALEYGGGGIIAGTQTILPVPEPSTFAFAGIGALMVGFWRCLMRRKHRVATPGG